MDARGYGRNLKNGLITCVVIGVVAGAVTVGPLFWAFS
jgi:hypothetical protein